MTTRPIDAPLAAEIAKPELRPFLALHIDLPDPVYAVTGPATILFDGQEWTGIGGLGSIDVIGEATDGSATGVRATLAMIPAEFRDDVADQAVRGCLVELYVGALDEAYTEVLGVKLVWKGRLDGYEIVDAGDTLTVTITGESRMIDQRRPTIKRFTDSWQQKRYPGDLAFQYVSRMVEVPILWARAKQDAVL